MLPEGLVCPHCGGNFYRDPDDRLAVVCMLCARSYRLANLGVEVPGTQKPPIGSRTKDPKAA